MEIFILSKLDHKFKVFYLFKFIFPLNLIKFLRFSGKIIDGVGITARRLNQAGIKTINEIEALELLEKKENENS